MELVGLVAVDQTRGSSHACEAGAQAREVADVAVVSEEDKHQIANLQELQEEDGTVAGRQALRGYNP